MLVQVCDKERVGVNEIKWFVWNERECVYKSESGKEYECV